MHHDFFQFPRLNTDHGANKLEMVKTASWPKTTLRTVANLVGVGWVEQTPHWSKLSHFHGEFLNNLEELSCHFVNLNPLCMYIKKSWINLGV